MTIPLSEEERVSPETQRERSISLFDRQNAGYRASVLPAGVPRVAVEAGVTGFWHKYVGAVDDPRAAIVGIDRFGESAPAGVLFKHFGFTVEHVGAAVRRVLE
jgi:transketolase